LHLQVITPTKVPGFVYSDMSQNTVILRVTPQIEAHPVATHRRPTETPGPGPMIHELHHQMTALGLWDLFGVEGPENESPQVFSLPVSSVLDFHALLPSTKGRDTLYPSFSRNRATSSAVRCGSTPKIEASMTVVA
jgi:hypothetical protein